MQDDEMHISTALQHKQQRLLEIPSAVLETFLELEIMLSYTLYSRLT